MREFIELLQSIGVCFGTGRVNEKTLRVVVTDDSACPIADFWFEDTDDADFVKVQPGDRLLNKNDMQ